MSTPTESFARATFTMFDMTRGAFEAARSDRIAQVRRELAAGTYETDAKLSVAADRLVDDLQLRAWTNLRRDQDDAGDRMEFDERAPRFDSDFGL